MAAYAFNEGFGSAVSDASGTGNAGTASGDDVGGGAQRPRGSRSRAPAT